MPLSHSPAQQLKARRTELNLTQAELAQRIGVTKAAVSAYERGKARPSGPVLAALAQQFDLSTSDLQNSLDRGLPWPPVPAPARVVPLLPVAQQSAFAHSLAPGGAPCPLPTQVAVPDLPATPDFAEALVIEVGQELMEPTLRAGARVLATPVPGPEWAYLPSGLYCVVYRRTLVIRRIKDNRLAQDQLLLLHADSPLGGTHPVRAEDLRAVWRLRWVVYAPID